MMEVVSVGGRSPTTAIRNTVMLSMAEMPRVIFSPESLGVMNTNRDITLVEVEEEEELTLMRMAGRM